MRLSAITIVVTGLLVGVFVGLAGTGGAFVIPVLVYVFKMSQLRAQGTALLIAASPIWFFPLIPYWRSGHCDLKIGLLLCIGIAAGGYLGADLAQHLPQEYLRKGFAIGLIAIAVKMFVER